MNKKEIKDMISYLKLGKDIKDNDAFTQIYNSPNRYLGNVFYNEVQQYSKIRNISLYESMLRFPRNDEWRYRNGIKMKLEIL